MADDQSLKDAKEGAKFLGQKLGLLIASLNITEEQRESLLTILPLFTLDQLQRLTGALETQLAADSTGDIDEAFRKELSAIQKQYADKIGKAEKEALDALSVFEKCLPNE